MENFFEISMNQIKVALIVFVFIASFLTVLITLEIDFNINSNKSLDRPPNVIMVSLTTLRPDHMPCYGYTRNTSPFICHFADKNVVFEQAIAQAPWTFPSQASTFTSQYPMVHGAIEERDNLSERSQTLAELLKSRGYDTAAFVGGGRDFYHFRKKYNLDQGFETYSVPGEYLNDTTSEALKSLNEDVSEPFFMFVQGYDIHNYGTRNKEDFFDKTYEGKFDDKRFSPYSIRKEDGNFTYRNFWNSSQETEGITVRDFKHVIASYDTNIRYSDRAIKSFFQELRRKGVYKNSLIIIYSGHGTNLNDSITNDNRVTGHDNLYDYNIHTPLIIKMPEDFGEADRKVEEQVEHIDLMPTVLETIGIQENKSFIQGESLLPFIKDKMKSTEYVYSQQNSKSSVRTKEWKLVISNDDIDKNLSKIYGQLIKINDSNKTRYFQNRTKVTERLKQKLGEWKQENLEVRNRK